MHEEYSELLIPWIISVEECIYLRHNQPLFRGNWNLSFDRHRQTLSMPFQPSFGLYNKAFSSTTKILNENIHEKSGATPESTNTYPSSQDPQVIDSVERLTSSIDLRN